MAGPPPPASQLSPHCPGSRGTGGGLRNSVPAVRGQASALSSSAALLSSAKLGYLSLGAGSGKSWLCSVQKDFPGVKGLGAQRQGAERGTCAAPIQ